MQGSIYEFDRTFNQFIQDKCSHTALLMALGKLAPVRQPQSLRFDWIEPLQAESNCPEFRLALSIASCGLKSHLYGEAATFAVGNPVESLVRLQRDWGRLADDGKNFCFYPSERRIFADFGDISAFISSASFDDRLFESWLWVLSLIDFNVRIDSPLASRDYQSAMLKLPSAYRIGAVHLKTFKRERSPVESIAYTGYLKPTISRLMGAKIYLKVPLSDRMQIGDIRAAAALAFPVSAKQVEAIIQKFFTQESDNLV